MSVVFLEIGTLKDGRPRKDGTVGNPIGEFTVHLEPNWRIEGPRSVACGSDDPVHAIERSLARLIGQTVEDVTCFGRLPELKVRLSSQDLLTFSASKGQPNWTINRWDPEIAMYSQNGKVTFDGDAPNNSFKGMPLRGTP